MASGTAEFMFSAWGLVALACFAAALFLVSLFKPHWGLAMALIGLYNPYYIYQTFLLEFNPLGAGRIRALQSTVSLAAVGIAVFMRQTARGKIRRVKTGMDWWLMAFGIFPLLGVFVGVWAENDLRLILSDVFPIVEFYCYFFIATMVLRDKHYSSGLVWATISGGTGSALILVVVYFVLGTDVRNWFMIYGGSERVFRLTDFMPVLLVPLVISMYIYTGSRMRGMILSVYSTVLLGVILLGFWRSQWIGLLSSIGFIIWADVGRMSQAVRRGIGLAGMFAVAVGVVSVSGMTQELFPRPLGEVIQARAMYLSPMEEEGGGRLEEVFDLLAVIGESPVVGKGMGGTFFTAAHPFLSGVTRFPLGSSHNYYLGLAAQAGVPALIVFLFSVLVFFKMGLDKVVSLPPGRDSGIILGILASFVAVGVTSLFTPNQLHFPIFAFLGVFAATVFTIAANEKRAGVASGQHPA